MNKLLAVMFCAACLSACATGHIVKNDIHPGMTRQQVVDVLGKPDGVRVAGQTQSLEYANRLISGWSWDRADYYVILDSGRVTSYGPGQIRHEGPNTLILVPLR